MREGACEHTRWSFCFHEPSRETQWRRETADIDVSPCERAKRMYPVYMDGAVCIYMFSNICSIHFSCSVVSDSLWSHGLQHSRLPCPSPTLRVYPNSCPLGQWCHPTISSSVISFSSCPQSFPASGSFQMSQFFPWGGQSIGVSASASVLPMNTQDWSPCSPRDSQESSPTPQFKSINSLALSFLYGPTLTSILDYWKNHSFD